jgi:NAD(P)-dependent dehydrogenase (short-subunit alcohol dehydrogenase family)
MKRILLIGATGTFGSRLAQHLARMPELHLFLASRSFARAQTAVAGLVSYGAAAKLTAIVMTTETGLETVLAEISPWLVIDASGPFQFSDFSVPRAVLNAGAHYLDLADARDFLMGFAHELDTLAQQKNLVARAGCSTTPAITTAVVDHVTRGWERIDAVDVTIVPGGSNTVGPALAAAVLSQAGAPVTQFHDGRYEQIHGWLKAKKVHVPRLGTFRATPAETADPMIMPERYGLTSRMTFRVGLVSGLEQRGFEALAWLRKSGVFKPIGVFAPLLAAGRNVTRLWSNDRGGMVINVSGVNAKGAWTGATWSLLAQQGDGPHVPILPLVAAVRMLLKNESASGARVVLGEIPLHRIEAEIGTLDISSQLELIPAVGLFEKVLGTSGYANLPPVLQSFHDVAGISVWEGEADVDRGTHPVSRIIAWIIGLPPAGLLHRVQVSVERGADGNEVWTRTFASQSFQSQMSASVDGKLRERFGPMMFTLGLKSSRQGTALPLESGSVFGIPIPRVLLPKSTAVEYVDEQGRFRFDVRLDLPFFGLLAHYRGWLAPKTEKDILLHDNEHRVDLAAE